MFSKKALVFFRQLERNNHREWFQPRKASFEELIRNPMIELVTRVNDQLRKFAVDYVVSDPAKALYRIYRDTRFSKDKTPYKTHIAAHFQHRRLPKNRAAGFYFHVSHSEVVIAGGIYMPGPEELSAVREAIARRPAAFEKLVSQPALVKKIGSLAGESLARVPKNYSPDHPAADRLRMKQFYFDLTLDPSAALKPTFEKTVVDAFRLMSPAVEYFNAAILASIKPDAADHSPKRPDPMF